MPDHQDNNQQQPNKEQEAQQTIASLQQQLEQARAEAEQLKKAKQEPTKEPAKKEPAKPDPNNTDVNAIVEARLKAYLESELQPLQEKYSAKDAEAQAYKDRFENSYKESAVVAAITELGGDAGTIEALKPVLQNKTKVYDENGQLTIRVMSDDGKVSRVDSKGRYMDVKQLVEELKKGPLGRTFPGSKQQGGGLGSTDISGIQNVDITKLTESQKIELTKKLGHRGYLELIARNLKNQTSQR